MGSLRAIFVLFLCGSVSASFAAGNKDIRIIYPDALGNACEVRGIVKSSVKRPVPLSAEVPIMQTGLFDDLKKQAAQLGGNRIVIRQGISTGTRTMIHGASIPTWEGTTFVAEAYKC